MISTSFADIFYNNCFKNGILPIVVSPEDLEKLMDDASRGSNATLTVDLEAKEIRGPDGGVVKFDLDDFKRHCLLNGLDDIGLTLEKAPAIAGFEQSAAEAGPGPERGADAPAEACRDSHAWRCRMAHAQAHLHRLALRKDCRLFARRGRRATGASSPAPPATTMRP